MIADSETNLVYFSELLPRRYPAIFKDISGKLKKCKIDYGLLTGTKDIWCRDYMPIQTGRKNFVSFRYEPSYLERKKDIRSIPRDICQSSRIETKYSNINLDGGNVVKWKDKVILTDRILDENPEFKQTPHKLIDALERLFQATIIMIPQIHPQADPFGHSDGYIRLVNDHLVIVNELSGEFKYFANRLKGVLHQHGLKYIEMPWFIEPDRKNPDSVVGNYINYLEVGNLVLVPKYRGYEDQSNMALGFLQTVFGPRKTVESVEMTDIANEGGVLNCISWNILKLLRKDK